MVEEQLPNNAQTPTQQMHVHINGTHCASCEVLLERRLKRVPGVEAVKVDFVTGQTDISYSRKPTLDELHAAIAKDGYTIGTAPQPRPPKTTRDFVEIGGAIIVVAGIYLLMKQFDLLPQGLGISDTMGYGIVFMMGLVASVSSCLAVTGGLLLAVMQAHNARHPGLSAAQKFKPHLHFNIGRIVGYTVLGGALGAIGAAIAPSPRTTALLAIMAGAVMIILGFQQLNLFPWLRRFQPKTPKFLAHAIHDAADRHTAVGPSLLGAATFFLPCGFTQALQLYVLSKGDVVGGALIMLAFSLGTLPGLLSLGALSSALKGATQRYFIRFAAVLVIVLGIVGMVNGFAAADLGFGGKTPTAVEPGAPIVNGKQVVTMKVVGYDYYPSQFTVVAGVPVEWHIDGTRAASCAQVVTVPSLGITEYLPKQGEKVVTFTPTTTGTIGFSCPMGMTTRGAAFTVVPNTEGLGAAPTSQPATPQACDPAVMICNVQKLGMTITREEGFSPNKFIVKKGIPI